MIYGKLQRKDNVETITQFFYRLKKHERRKDRRIIVFKDKWHPVKWKYFSEKESENLIPDLMFKLDRTREYYGHPIIITSGFRTPEKNKKIGGVKNSAHTKGMAVDIRVPKSKHLRERLAWAIGKGGFSRVITYPKHYHLDVDDQDKPSPVFSKGKYR